MATFHIGLSGFSYPTWKGEGRFYPPDVPAAKFLQYYATRYNAVEMDGSFYKNPTENSIVEWIKKTPDPFQFSFKAHRRVTHLSRLKPESIESINYMLPRMVPMAKQGRLGPFLVQLPPNFKRDDARLTEFLSKLPRDLSGVEGGSSDDKLKYAMEFRNDTWHSDEVETILRENGVGWVASDRDVMPAQKRDTADFLYARLRRSEYNPADLDPWADYFNNGLKAGKDCYVYCKHEDEGSPWIWADYLLTKI
ncbi:MAG: hypothetical protein QOJ65_2244 [Fimbriimonadaceae bacterium]|jgi:uncharacterized protein YecE (DUF72 family)|nr:hypothetical protein [Fimbriimonadaceae bacterium]